MLRLSTTTWPPLVLVVTVTRDLVPTVITPHCAMSTRSSTRQRVPLMTPAPHNRLAFLLTFPSPHPLLPFQQTATAPPLPQRVNPARARPSALRRATRFGNGGLTAPASPLGGGGGGGGGAGAGGREWRHGHARRVSEAENVDDETWWQLFFRPSRRRVDGWLSSFWKRHLVLTVLPCLAVWVWVAMPFPVNDPYKDSPLPDIPSWPKRPKTPDEGGGGGGMGGDDDEVLPLDANFYFFLFWYFGMYLAVALFFITNLFSLYRLNWWPSLLGGKTTYSLIWGLTLAFGLTAHHLDMFGLHQRYKTKPDSDSFDWERKTFWVVLSFAAMHIPAIACFSKLKRDKRHIYRHIQPVVQDTFFGQAFRRMPSSWLRFLWFMACLAIASFSVIAGQAYASLFLSTLPHTSLDAGTWVWSWVITVQLLAQISYFIITSKVRSRALLFLYKLFFQLVYHVFYRNLFARLRSPSQFATVQLLSSIAVVCFFPLQMTKPWYKMLQIVVGYSQPFNDHLDNVAVSFYCRSLAQNTTMVGFLGWLSILHFGSNSQIYPFFKFQPTEEDPYTFGLTFVASCAVWGSELISSFVARQLMRAGFGVDVSQVGLDEMREYPELVPACGWASVHVSMNILLFLIKLNFR
ncbi:uncharacterized protein EHS24_008080 [Apiotrichum porosum]|uniref:Uncharacterized protein n=1 Tax=Apiotrichum porosum TaxID=105984 RepID=A0A427XSS0_9TREE|nr:uncharacterized protein EHS24_008080 [Apiotrichum porosum]RSH81884.1 hypothetical protein EHS24_008080 [Apiotrichum porosum]